MTAEVLLVTSIDTEEDDWIPRREGVTHSNLRELPRLQEVLERFGARPTYFTTYRAARDPAGAEILRALATSGKAEVAAHLHPWNTPPLMEEPRSRNTMLCNLPAPLQEAKIRVLTDGLGDVLGRAPTAFRAGRHGFGPETVGALLRCGYRVDSSVLPFVDWRACSDGPDFFGAPMNVYRLAEGATDTRVPDPDGALVELPLSSGYTRTPFALWSRADRLLRSRPIRRARMVGIAARIGLMKRIVLSPETSSLADLLLLSRRILQEGVPFLHWSWHSPSLAPGLSPFVRTVRDLDHFYRVIECYLERVSALAPIRFATVSEAAASLERPSSQPARQRAGSKATRPAAGLPTGRSAAGFIR